MSHYYAQARPQDYAKELLQLNAPISFHKFWHLDPIFIYRKWFYDLDRQLFLARNKTIKTKTAAVCRLKKSFLSTNFNNQLTLPIQIPVVAASVHHKNCKHIDF